ncbi:MAG TPA: TrkA C-terminal domain-containing protein [Natrialbaceae archaeon]|nr:TrkA C-terminal domain-containing protein [Natrialbaceae archaeon]
MATLPIEVLYGIYLGLLTGIIPAFVAGALGFVFRYVTGVTLPGLGVVALAVAIAGINGGLLGLLEEDVVSSPRLLVAVIVVMMLALYAHSQGDKLGQELPRRFSLQGLRRRTLSADVVEFVGGMGRVTITASPPIKDLEGYPALPADLRETLAEGRWEFPADLPLSELESRLAERLRTEHDLTDVSVAVDERGEATIAAAPPSGGLSRRVPATHRAVSIAALVPTGLARGESVRVITDRGTVEGTLLSATSDPKKASPTPPPDEDGAVTDGGDAEESAAPAAHARAPTTDGGEGQVTVAVPRADARTLLVADRGKVVVRSRGTRREYELLSLFRRTGNRVRRVAVGSDGDLDGVTLGEAAVRDAYGVAVLALRHSSGAADERGADRRWTFSPRGDATVTAGDELFVVGDRDALARFEEAIA